ncbi:hypothetical protein [Sphingomonas sp. PvP056]|uniref:hypothetical protein n=1 Tax=Sphingomonas sp. PvP056 TaxID=3156392 RepID=UPI00339A6109
MAKSASPTGGQINLSGILYQLLASLADGLDAVVTTLAAGADAATIELQVEPFEGGDYTVLGPHRTVVQVKRRAAHRHWTLGAIIADVLPDLSKSVRPGTNDAYQFLTDNDAGCGDFRRFLQWYRARAADEPIDNELFRLGRGGRKVSGEAVLESVREALDISGPEDPRLAALLCALTIVRRSEGDLDEAIARPLRIMVENVEDVAAKRAQLVGELVRLGGRGATLRTSEFLRAAQLDPRRLVHAGRLAAKLRNELIGAFPQFRYDPARDVRRPLPAPTRSVTVLRGESGLGKSWRLCATALRMAEAGRPVVLLRATADVDRLRETIASLVWNPVYTAAAPLRSIADRLRPALGDERRIWLTVFLDDLNDPALAGRVIEDSWDRLGIDLVISAQPATAEWLRTSFAAPHMIDVPEFTTPELIAHLEKHRIDHSHVPDDVFSLLHKPVLASLYCQLPHGLVLNEETEYQLMQSFWSHVASERPASLAQTFDLDQLQLLVGDMLAAPPIYPWPPSAFVRTLDFDAVERLVLRGLVELDGERRLAMTHDRLLNWTMARHLADIARDRHLDPAQLLDLLRQVQDLVTVAGVKIGARFGYVLMDLLWLLLEPARWPAARVAELLLGYMRDPEFEAHDQSFFSRTLPTLGVRAVPLLRALAESGMGGDREALWPAWVALGLRKAADVAWDDVRTAAVEMFQSNDPAIAEIALRVLGKVAAPVLLDPLNALNVARAAALDEADPDIRMDRIHDKERSTAAFARAVAADPAWLDRKIASTTETLEAEQLLWVLRELDRTAAFPIWQARRAHLFAVIRTTARILPQAVRTFADPVDLPRLVLPAPEGADLLFGAATFDAIARLDPERALALLHADRGDESAFDELGADGWWVPGLHYRTRERLGAALRERAGRGDPAMSINGLASIYRRHPELIDEETADLLLDALAARLEAPATDDDDPLRGSWRLLSTLSSLRTAAALDRIAARRGTALEAALAELAAGRPPNSSRVVDRDGEMVARLLAVMAGEGFDRLTVAQIDSSGQTTRDYGLGHALWTTSPAVGAALDQLSNATDTDEDRPYHLMQALAAHRGDNGIARLIGASSPVYTHAVDIRQGHAGEDETLVTAIRTRVATSDPQAHIEAVDLSHFLPPLTALDLTAPLIAVAAGGDALARRLMMLHFHHGHYEPALHAKLAPLFDGEDEAGEIAALHHAINGDAGGRALAVRWLEGRGRDRWRSLQVAMTLLDHADSRAAAISFLNRHRDRRFHMGRLDAEVLDALARHGDAVASEELVQLAFGTGARDLDAVAGAVRLVAQKGTPGIFQAARRLFAKSGQQEAARLLIETNAREGLTELVTAYVGAPLPRRLAIARTLRWNVSRARLAPALAGMSRARDEATRQMAAEIAGWLPHRWQLQWLGDLAADPVREVEEAALAAFHRRAAGAAAVELMAVIPKLAKPAQWACLSALVELVDPHLLIKTGDTLDIRPLLERLPPEFGIEAKRTLERQRDDMDRKVAREAKD